MKKFLVILFAVVCVFFFILGTRASSALSFNDAQKIFDEVWDITKDDAIRVGIFKKPKLKLSITHELQFLFMRNAATVPDLTKTVLNVKTGTVDIWAYDIIVSMSMIAKSTPEEIRAIFAHEMGHVVMNHPKYRLQYALDELGVPKSIFGAINFLLNSNNLGKKNKLFSIYMKGQEYFADQYAAKILIEMERNPRELCEALRSISLPEFMEKLDPSHPTTNDRCDAIEFYADSDYFMMPTAKIIEEGSYPFE